MRVRSLRTQQRAKQTMPSINPYAHRRPFRIPVPDEFAWGMILRTDQFDSAS